MSSQLRLRRRKKRQARRAANPPASQPSFASLPDTSASSAPPLAAQPEDKFNQAVPPLHLGDMVTLSQKNKTVSARLTPPSLVVDCCITTHHVLFSADAVFRLVHGSKVGALVKYGDEVSLQHVHTGGFLAWTRALAASGSALDVVLAAEPSEQTRFRVLPRYDFQAEGDAVNSADPVVLAFSEGATTMYLHDTLLEADAKPGKKTTTKKKKKAVVKRPKTPQPRKPLQQEAKVRDEAKMDDDSDGDDDEEEEDEEEEKDEKRDLDVSVHPSVFVMRLYRAHVGQEDVADADLSGGDVVRLFHRENVAYLSASTTSNKDDAVLRRLDGGGARRVATVWDLWQIELEDRADGHACAWLDTQLHLRHVSSGRYLAGVPLEQAAPDSARQMRWVLVADKGAQTRFVLTPPNAVLDTSKSRIADQSWARVRHVLSGRHLSSENAVAWYERSGDVVVAADGKVLALDDYSDNVDEEVFEVARVAAADLADMYEVLALKPALESVTVLDRLADFCRVSEKQRSRQDLLHVENFLRRLAAVLVDSAAVPRRRKLFAAACRAVCLAVDGNADLQRLFLSFEGVQALVQSAKRTSVEMLTLTAALYKSNATLLEQLTAHEVESFVAIARDASLRPALSEVLAALCTLERGTRRVGIFKNQLFVHNRLVATSAEHALLPTAIDDDPTQLRLLVALVRGPNSQVATQVRPLFPLEALLPCLLDGRGDHNLGVREACADLIAELHVRQPVRSAALPPVVEDVIVVGDEKEEESKQREEARARVPNELLSFCSRQLNSGWLLDLLRTETDDEEGDDKTRGRFGFAAALARLTGDLVWFGHARGRETRLLAAVAGVLDRTMPVSQTQLRVSALTAPHVLLRRSLCELGERIVKVIIHSYAYPTTRSFAEARRHLVGDFALTERNPGSRAMALVGRGRQGSDYMADFQLNAFDDDGAEDGEDGAARDEDDKERFVNAIAASSSSRGIVAAVGHIGGELLDRVRDDDDEMTTVQGRPRGVLPAALRKALLSLFIYADKALAADAGRLLALLNEPTRYLRSAYERSRLAHGGPEVALPQLTRATSAVSVALREVGPDSPLWVEMNEAVTLLWRTASRVYAARKSTHRRKKSDPSGGSGDGSKTGAARKSWEALMQGLCELSERLAELGAEEQLDAVATIIDLDMSGLVALLLSDSEFDVRRAAHLDALHDLMQRCILNNPDSVPRFTHEGIIKRLVAHSLSCPAAIETLSLILGAAPPAFIRKFPRALLTELVEAYGRYKDSTEHASVYLGVLRRLVKPEGAAPVSRTQHFLFSALMRNEKVEMGRSLRAVTQLETKAPMSASSSSFDVDHDSVGVGVSDAAPDENERVLRLLQLVKACTLGMNSIVELQCQRLIDPLALLSLLALPSARIQRTRAFSPFQTKSVVLGTLHEVFIETAAETLMSAGDDAIEHVRRFLDRTLDELGALSAHGRSLEDGDVAYLLGQVPGVLADLFSVGGDALMAAAESMEAAFLPFVSGTDAVDLLYRLSLQETRRETDERVRQARLARAMYARRLTQLDQLAASLERLLGDTGVAELKPLLKRRQAGSATGGALSTQAALAVPYDAEDVQQHLKLHLATLMRRGDGDDDADADARTAGLSWAAVVRVLCCGSGDDDSSAGAAGSGVEMSAAAKSFVDEQAVGLLRDRDGRPSRVQSEIFFRNVISFVRDETQELNTRKQLLMALQQLIVEATRGEAEAAVQAQLVELGFVELFMGLVTTPTHLSSLAWHLCADLLGSGSSRVVQREFLRQFRQPLGRRFFDRLKSSLRSYTWRTNDADGASAGDEDAAVVESVMECVRLCCEGHFLEMQRFLLERDGEERELNIVGEVLDLWLATADNVIEMLGHTSSPLEGQSLSMLARASRVLIELCQGPCPENQRFLANQKTLLVRIHGVLVALQQRVTGTDDYLSDACAVCGSVRGRGDAGHVDGQGLVASLLRSEKVKPPCSHYVCGACPHESCPACHALATEVALAQLLLALIEGAAARDIFLHIVESVPSSDMLARLERHSWMWLSPAARRRVWNRNLEGLVGEAEPHAQLTVLYVSVMSTVGDHEHLRKPDSELSRWGRPLREWRAEQPDLVERVLEVEILRDDKIERVHFKVPEMFVRFKDRPEVRREQLDLLENRAVGKGPEERLKTYLRRSQDVVAAFKHMARLEGIFNKSRVWRPFVWLTWAKPWQWWRVTLLLAVLINVLLIKYGEGLQTSAWEFDSSDRIMGATPEQWIRSLLAIHFLCSVMMTLEFFLSHGFLIFSKNFAGTAHVQEVLSASIVLPSARVEHGGGVQSSVRDRRSLSYIFSLEPTLKGNRDKLFRILKAFWSPYIAYYTAYFTFSVLANVWSPYWSSFFLFDFVLHSTTTGYVIRAVAARATQMLATIALGIVLLYGCSVLAFRHFQNQAYSFLDIEADQYNCRDSLLSCVQMHLDHGLRSTPIWGSRAEPDPSWIHDAPFAIPSFDLFFFVVLNVVVTSVVTGLVIDQFSETRANNEEINQELTSRCFVCDIDRDSLEEYGSGWSQHIRNEHNMWAYVALREHLRKKARYFSTEMSGQESYVWNAYAEGRTDFLPINRSRTLERGS